MSVHFCLINDRDRKTLWLGTGCWDGILGWQATHVNADHVLTCMLEDPGIRTWGEARLRLWAEAIVGFANGAETRLGLDYGTTGGSDGSEEYECVGNLKDMKP